MRTRSIRPFTVREGAAFTVALTGLTGGIAEIGTHATISYTINPDNGTDTAAWGATPGGTEYGTGTSPTDFTAGDGGALYLQVTDGGETVTRSASIRYAAPVAGTLAPVSETAAIGGTVAVDVSSGFSGSALTYSVPLAGWYNLAGSTLTIDLDAARSTSITVTATNSGGSVDVAQAVTIALPAAPTITLTPSSDTISAGATGTVASIGVTGTGVTLSELSGDTGVFEISGSNLNLSAAAVEGSYGITLRATDDWARTADAAFSLTVEAVEITATVEPAAQSLTTDDALNTITNYATLVDETNYATNAPGETIASAVVQVDGVTQAGTYQVWGLEAVTVLVTDTGGNTREWTIDAEVTNTAFVMEVTTITGSQGFTIPMKSSGTYSGRVNMGNNEGDQTFSGFSDSNLTTVYLNPGTYPVRMSGEIGGFDFLNAGPTTRSLVTKITSIGSSLVMSTMNGAFTGTAITEVTFGNCDTTGITSLYNCFGSCLNLVIADITGINTASVINFQQWFVNCPSLTTVIGFTGLSTASLTVRADEVFHRSPNVNFSAIDIRTWNLTQLSTTSSMFNFIPDTAALDGSMYNDFLINLEAQRVSPGLSPLLQLSLGDTPVIGLSAEAQAARTNLINEGIAIEDNGNAPPNVADAPATSAVTGSSVTVTLPSDPFTNGLRISTRAIEYIDITNGGSWTPFGSGYTEGQAVVVSGLTTSTEYQFRGVYTNFDGTTNGTATAGVTTLAGASGIGAMEIENTFIVA